MGLPSLSALGWTLRRQGGSLPLGVDARYLLGIVRNLHTSTRPSEPPCRLVAPQCGCASGQRCSARSCSARWGASDLRTQRARDRRMLSTHRVTIAMAGKLDRPSTPGVTCWETSSPRRLMDGVRWTQRGVRGDPLVAAIEIDRPALTAALGPPTAPDALLDGIGPMQVWTLAWPCGCEVALWSISTPQHPEPRGVDVLSNDADVDHVLHHLALDAPVLLRADELPPELRAHTPRRWTLVRQDDNGVRVAMRTFDSRLAAECARKSYEARGHKQLYTLERADLA